MRTRLHDSIDEFRAVAEPLYRRDPVVHTVELTLLHAGGLPEDSLGLTVWDDGMPVGAVMQTSLYPLVCNAIPVESVPIVAAELSGSRPDLVGVRGLRDTAVAFAQAWHADTGRPTTVTTEERLYQLGSLRAPKNMAGALRVATDDDRALLIDWVELFYRETFGHPRDDAAGERLVDTASRVGDRFVLWDVDGVAVSTAMLRAPAAGVSRIGPVFTSRDRRGHGYAAAVTAAAADLAHRSGTADVVLFADLANPVSNAIYQRIGFEAVVDSVRIDFGTLG